jgi:L-alanine-DL-glutamate epimerase-like enolase superfamily enzyme
MTGSAPVVERLRAHVLTVPTDLPEADGTLAWDHTTMVVVQVSSSGAVGLGYSYTSGAAAEVIHGVLSQLVVGSSVWSVAGTADAMGRAVRNLGRTGVVACAISAVDTALWDLKSRLLELPLADLLGRVRNTVPVYGSGGFTTYDAAQLQQQVAGWLAQGITRVKIKVGESWGADVARDLRRTGQVRELVGPQGAVMVDANGGYTAGQAVRVAEALTDLGVDWFEEPVSSDDLRGLREVRSQTTPDVAAGEYGYSLPYFGAMLRAQAVDCLQIDATRCGGYTTWLRAAAVADADGVQVSAHCAPALHAPMLLAVPNARHQEYFHDHVRIESLLFPGSLEVAGGELQPTGHGHGLVLDEDAAGRFTS